MVSRGISVSDCSNYTSSDGNEEDQDTISVATVTSTSEQEDGGEDGGEDDKSQHNELVLTDVINDKEKPSFGNIAVSNSTDIHFGNKTYYQGPVTIKQFLYTNPQVSDSDLVSDSCDESKLPITNGVTVPVPDSLGKDNPNFVPDNVTIKCEQNINQNDNKIVNNCTTETQQTDVDKGNQWLQNFSRQHIFLVISLVAMLVISLVTLLAVLLTRHHQASSPNDPVAFPLDSPEQDVISPPGLDSNFTLPPKLKIIYRIVWVAQPAVEPLTPLHTPAPYVIIMHTATEFCSDHPTCILHVRYIQQFHIESKGWWDIGYNFLIGGDGFAYEGRGWKAEGAHTYGYNSKSIGIAFIGTFNNTMPPERSITAAKQLIEKGVELNFIAKNYKLFAARQLQSTQSPGQLLFEDIKTWPHWTEKPQN